MDEKIYEIDNRKPSLLPRIGTVAVAICSFAAAAAVASPSLTSFGTAIQEIAQPAEPTAAATQHATIIDRATSEPTLPSQQVDPATNSSLAASTQNFEVADVALATEPQPWSPTKVNPVATPSPAQTPALKDLAVALPDLGNTSSPTPTGGGSYVGGGSTSAPVGNLSTSTPSSGSVGVYKDDDYDDDHEEPSRGERDHEDDDHEDDD